MKASRWTFTMQLLESLLTRCRTDSSCVTITLWGLPKTYYDGSRPFCPAEVPMTHPVSYLPGFCVQSSIFHYIYEWSTQVHRRSCIMSSSCLRTVVLTICKIVKTSQRCRCHVISESWFMSACLHRHKWTDSHRTPICHQAIILELIFSVMYILLYSSCQAELEILRPGVTYSSQAWCGYTWKGATRMVSRFHLYRMKNVGRSQTCISFDVPPTQWSNHMFRIVDGIENVDVAIFSKFMTPENAWNCPSAKRSIDKVWALMARSGICLALRH